MRALVVAVLLVACGDDAALVDAGADTGGDDASMPDGNTCLARATYPLQIAAGAFPPVGDNPNVLVYQPPGFDRTAPVDLVVYIHGFTNCVENVLGETGTECTPGAGTRQAYSLAAQLDASTRNTLLILPEVAFDMASGDPGQLGAPDGLRALLAETLSSLPSPLGPLDLAAHGRIIVASHSGGYTAASAVVTFGGVPVDELWLLDSLYGYTSRFDAWVMQDLASFTNQARRFVDVYTASGGTDSNSRAMATRAAGWVDPSVILDDRTTATLTDADYHHGLIFKLSGLSHNDVPRYYFERLLATTSLGRTCE